MGSILIDIIHFNVLRNPCDLHNSKTINMIDMQCAIYIIQRCFSQSKYNLCYIPVHVQSFFGKTFSAQGGGGRGNITPPLPNPVQSKYNRHNQNTIVQSKYNHTIQIKSQNPNTIDKIQIQLT